MNKNERKVKVMRNKNGQGVPCYRIALPTPFVNALKLNEDMAVNIRLEGDKIIIEKGGADDER